jgi:hypothetical protein
LRARDVRHRVPQHEQVRGDLRLRELEAVALDEVAEDLRLAVEARDMHPDRPAERARSSGPALAALGGLLDVAVGEVARLVAVDRIDQQHEPSLDRDRPVVVHPDHRHEPRAGLVRVHDPLLGGGRGALRQPGGVGGQSVSESHSVRASHGERSRMTDHPHPTVVGCLYGRQGVGDD